MSRGRLESEEDLAQFRERLMVEFAAMADLLAAKRRGYGATALTRFGPLGIVIRASDKIDRLANMIQAGAERNADGDSMEDAVRDLIGYGALGLLWYLEQRDRAG